MHAEAYGWIRSVLTRLPEMPASVVELGSRNINGTARDLFNGHTRYVGVDLTAGPGVDILSDAAAFAPVTPPDLVVCAETLEHAPNAAAIVTNAYTMVRPGGAVILTCASRQRAPHSAVDGATLRAGEHYAGLAAETLADWGRAAGALVREVQEHPDRGDSYVWLEKPDTGPISRQAATSLRVLVIHPGASWSTSDVDAGLCYGLAHHGVEVLRYRLDGRIPITKTWMDFSWQQAKELGRDVAEPTREQILYEAAWPVLEPALRNGVDAVIIVSGMFFPLAAVHRLKEAHLKVFIVFTESPYDIDEELKWAGIVDGCWTNERSTLARFRTVNPRCGYLPHGWHPERHRAGSHAADLDVPAHDVVFVGSQFSERVQWLEAIDWRGIDFGLYGQWDGLPEGSPLRAFLREGQIDNVRAAALYRRAKIGLNLYRQSIGWGDDAPRITHAESLNPRAYELAACGAFSISDFRAEVADVFGGLVPTFTTPQEAESLIRRWLRDDAERARVAAQLPACVAGASWVARAAMVLGDLQTFLPRLAA